MINKNTFIKSLAKSLKRKKIDYILTIEDQLVIPINDKYKTVLIYYVEKDDIIIMQGRHHSKNQDDIETILIKAMKKCSIDNFEKPILNLLNILDCEKIKED